MTDVLGLRDGSDVASAEGLHARLPGEDGGGGPPTAGAERSAVAGQRLLLFDQRTDAQGTGRIERVGGHVDVPHDAGIVDHEGDAPIGQ